MKWTTAADIKALLERRWSSGELCRAAVGRSECFPLSVRFKAPSAKTMLEAFGDTQEWVKLMITFAEKHSVELEWRDYNHRNLGKQRIPAGLVLANPEQAAALIGKQTSLQRFCNIYETTATQLPELQAWLLKRPIHALELEQEWFRLIDLCVWMQRHPTPKIYLRQVDLAGIDSKFIESYRLVLAELYDLVLPHHAINNDFSGVKGFARRYGFLDKPLMLRVRPLDSNIRLLYTDGSQDVVMDAQAFASLQVEVQSKIKRIFIVENEINYLSFPDLSNALVLFGSGYGFDALKPAKWLNMCDLWYWGDIDTHGFAILDQLRAHYPQVQSLLMDRYTLLKHQPVWGFEPKQEKKTLTRLTQEEAALYDDLRSNSLADQLRLEQERIGFEHVNKHLLATNTPRNPLLRKCNSPCEHR